MLNTVLKNLGLIAVLTGAMLTSMGHYPYNVYAFNFGAFIYMVWAIRVKDKNLMVVNGGLLAIYSAGML